MELKEQKAAKEQALAKKFTICSYCKSESGSLHSAHSEPHYFTAINENFNVIQFKFHVFILLPYFHQIYECIFAYFHHSTRYRLSKANSENVLSQLVF